MTITARVRGPAPAVVDLPLGRRMAEGTAKTYQAPLTTEAAALHAVAADRGSLPQENRR